MNDSALVQTDRNDSSNVEPIWLPSAESIQNSNIAAAMRQLSFDSFDDLYRWSIDQPEKFWAWVLERLEIRFANPPASILAPGASVIDPVWFAGARMNIAESCFQAPADSIAIVSGNENGDIARTTVRELRSEALSVANGLRSLGLNAGDVVGLLMPMNARSVAIYLGAILAGCAVVSLADSLSSEQLLLRLKIGKAKVVFTAEYIQRNGKLVPLSSRIANTSLPIILADGPGSAERPSTERGITWDSFIRADDSEVIVHAEPSTAINILFSSGTTGEPKAIPWDHVTPMRAASDGHFHQDIHAGDVVAWPTSYGWMMGPWLTFATLINRGTIALFDGAPTGGAFGRFVQDAGVNIQGVVPTLVSRWRQSRCMEEFDWSAIRLFSSTGECSNPSDMRYLSELANGKPVIEYCGGTELGGGYISSTIVQPNLPSLFSTPTLGSEYLILDDDRLPADVGEAYLVPPALGMSRRLLNADHFNLYYRNVPAGPNQETLRRHGDRLQRLPNGYTRTLGRTDDTFNISGIKVSSVELERALEPLHEVAEVAVIAVPRPGGGPNRLVACAGCGDKPQPDKNALQARMQSLISEMYCPLFRLDDLMICSRLPRTASNKINRREIRALYEQECKVNVGAHDE